MAQVVYTTAQIKVRNATAKDTAGPLESDMAEIAQLTFADTATFYEIMDILDTRLTEKRGDWRHVLKSLKVLDYCLQRGSKRVVEWIRTGMMWAKKVSYMSLLYLAWLTNRKVRVTAYALTARMCPETVPGLFGYPSFPPSPFSAAPTPPVKGQDTLLARDTDRHMKQLEKPILEENNLRSERNSGGISATRFLPSPQITLHADMFNLPVNHPLDETLRSSPQQSPPHSSFPQAPAPPAREQDTSLASHRGRYLERQGSQHFAAGQSMSPLSNYSQNHSITNIPALIPNDFIPEAVLSHQRQTRPMTTQESNARSASEPEQLGDHHDSLIPNIDSPFYKRQSADEFFAGEPSSSAPEFWWNNLHPGMGKPPSWNTETESYLAVFRSLSKDGKHVAGKDAVPTFVSSQLSTDQLRQIWDLVDFENTGHLNPGQWCIALHLIRNVMKGAKMPPTLPAEALAELSLIADSYATEHQHYKIAIDFVDALVSDGGLKRYRSMFNTASHNGLSIDANLAAALFQESGLSQDHLGYLWAVVDFDSTGKLDFGQFCIAMRLIVLVLKGTTFEFSGITVPWIREAHQRITEISGGSTLSQSSANSLQSVRQTSSHPESEMLQSPPTRLVTPLSTHSIVSNQSLGSTQSGLTWAESAKNERKQTISSLFTPQRTGYNDDECLNLSRLLKDSGRHQWSTSPRIYIVLRKIGQLQHLDHFLDHGINDLWLPITKQALPSVLSTSLQDQFIETQKIVLTKALDLENPTLARHAHFAKSEQLPFEEAGRLGEGGFGYVDRVISRLSGREYARKRFRRYRDSQYKERLKSFKTEVDVLKRIQHIHCVNLVASYTDSKWFGILMTPVADSNLAVYFKAADESKQQIMMTFFGCLAHALQYLHECKIRHRDIKPENILVKGDRVYFTDFGIALDWENLTHSTTTKDTAKSLIYCAPEVAKYEKRNSSSDIWSLGCVFVEMWTAINQRTVQEMRDFFKSKTESYRFYENAAHLEEWLSTARLPSVPSAPLKWMMGMMLLEEAAQRATIDVLCSRIAQDGQDSTQSPFCGECCMQELDGESEIDENRSDSDPLATTTADNGT